MEQVIQHRKLAMKLSDDGFTIHAMCGHCKGLNLLSTSHLEEVGRVGLDSHSAQVTYDFDCQKCSAPGQLYIVAEDD